MLRRIGIVVLGCMLVPACDAENAEQEMMVDEYLDREVVTSIPAGDASGNAFSGGYQMSATVVSCAGACGPIEVGGTRYMVCERDLESVEWVSVTQEDGVLRVNLDDDGHIGINVDGYVPILLRGGINADGSWDIGGYDTKFADALESTARARGTVQPDEPLEGTLEVYSHGEFPDADIDCRSTLRLVSITPPE